MKSTSTKLKAIALAGLLPLAAFGQTAAGDNGPTDAAHSVTGSNSGTFPVGATGQTQGSAGSGAAHDNTGAMTITSPSPTPGSTP